MAKTEEKVKKAPDSAFEEGVPEYPIQHPPWASDEAAGPTKPVPEEVRKAQEMPEDKED
jgi:hypothetical protein